jgi:hypothetical protein
MNLCKTSVSCIALYERVLDEYVLNDFVLAECVLVECVLDVSVHN